MKNKTLIGKLYPVSRWSLNKYEQDGTLIDELAKKGVAIYPSRLEKIANNISWNRLYKLPNDLQSDEKEFLRQAFSYPEGPILMPIPRVGAPKGYYYDERKLQWKKRPYVRIPG